MSDDSKIRRTIQELAGNDGNMLHVCIVDSGSVSGSKCDVTPLHGAAPMKGVRLNADINSDKGILVRPKEESIVLVCEISPSDAYVAMFSEIEGLSVKVKDKFEVEIKEGEVSFNGGEFGGMVKHKETTDNLKSIKNYVQALKMATGVIATAVDAMVPGTGAAFNSAMASQMIVLKDIENSKVKH